MISATSRRIWAQYLYHWTVDIEVTSIIILSEA